MIGIDLTIANPPFTGVQRVSYLAAVALAQKYGIGLHAWMAPTTPPIEGGSVLHRAPTVCAKPLGRILWQQTCLTKAAVQNGVEVLFCPGGTAPPANALRTVVLIHDLIAFRRPDLCRRLNAWHMRTLTPRSVREAYRIITASNTVAEEVAIRFQKDSATIRVIPFAPAPDILQPPSNTTRNFNRILFVGTVEKRKGIENLLRAFQRAAAKQPRLELEIVGHNADKALGRRIAAYNGPGKLLVTGYLARVQLIERIYSAGCCVLPSLDEGFGLPVQEAMAAGTPIVHSNIPALAETADNHGFSVPPDDPDALADTLIAALNSDPKKTEAAKIHARRRTWTDWANDFADAIT